MERLNIKHATRAAVGVGLWTTLALTAQGCATSEPAADYKPYEERAETQVQGDLSVTVALPTAAEAADIYGVDLAEKRIQPVWIEIQNDADVPYWFLASGLDPNYFSSSEVAYAFRSADDDHALDERFELAAVQKSRHAGHDGFRIRADQPG